MGGTPRWRPFRSGDARPNQQFPFGATGLWRLRPPTNRDHAAGIGFFTKRDDKEEIAPVTLFADVDGE